MNTLRTDHYMVEHCKKYNNPSLETGNIVFVNPETSFLLIIKSIYGLRFSFPLSYYPEYVLSCNET